MEEVLVVVVATLEVLVLQELLTQVVVEVVEMELAHQVQVVVV